MDDLAPNLFNISDISDISYILTRTMALYSKFFELLILPIFAIFGYQLVECRGNKVLAKSIYSHILL